MKTVSWKWIAIVIMVTIIIAVAAACVWLYHDYLVAPRQP